MDDALITLDKTNLRLRFLVTEVRFDIQDQFYNPSVLSYKVKVGYKCKTIC